MKVSELIIQLQALLDENGDLEVYKDHDGMVSPTHRADLFLMADADTMFALYYKHLPDNFILVE